MLTLKKKVLFLFTAALFSFGAAFSFGVSTTHASLFDFIRAFVTINPLAVEVTAPPEAEINRIFKVEANVINKGEVKIENVTGQIFLPAELVLSGKEIKNIGIVRPGREKKVSWSVKGESIGEGYIIAVSISGTVLGDAVTAEGDSKLVKIVKKAPPPGQISSISSGIFERFFDFLSNWFGR